MPCPQNMADLMAEHEAALMAEANTPERRAADAELFARNRERMAAEVASLERQGMIDHGGDDEPCDTCGLPADDPDCECGYDSSDHDGEGDE